MSMTNYLLSSKEQLTQAIRDIEFLETEYLNLVSDYNHQNSGKAINAYRAWYNKVAVVCNAVFGSTDEDVKAFRSLNNNCNGYGMYDNYVAIEGTYSIMKDRLKSCLSKEDIETPLDDNEHTLLGIVEPMVFISHAGNDKEIIGLFIDWILKNCIGLKDENIICTSFEKNTTKIGSDIPQYIKEKIACSSVVIAAVSQSYKASEVCMNEVGASWALDKEPLQIVLPDADFEDLGWLLETRKAAKLADNASLSLFVETLCEKLSLSKPSLATWTDSSSKFYEALKNVYVKSNGDKEKQVYLTFDNGLQECNVTVPLKVTNFISSPKKQSTRPDLNKVVFGGSGLEAALASINQTVTMAQVVVPSNNSVNKSMLPFRLTFVNNGSCLEDVGILISGEGVRFDRTNKKSTFPVASFANPMNRIKDESCDFNFGDCNAEMNYKVPEFYLEFNGLYKEYGVYEYNSNEKFDFVLNYTISTKHKKYEGQLVIHVSFESHEECVANDKKAGCSSTSAFIVDA